MRTTFAALIAVGVGLGLCALGVSIFLYGTQQPIICRSAGNRGGCGNLPLIVGVFTVVAGLVTIGGTIAYLVKIWEHEDVEFPYD